MPWNAGTSAKVILAHFPDDDRKRILTTSRVPEINTKTTTEPPSCARFWLAFEQTVTTSASQDLDPGIIGIAGPVFDHHGAMAGAIGRVRAGDPLE